MSVDIFFWELSLCVVAAINVLIWSLSATSLSRRQSVLTAEDYKVRRLQLLLSAGYVFGCAFRSIFPVYDVPRLCLVDSWLCSVIIGRSVATIAELCFAAQWALLLREISRATGSNVGKTTAGAIVPTIAIAEAFSWYSVLTTSNLGHVIEESLWAMCAVLLVASLAAIWKRCHTTLRPLLALWCAAGVSYVAFMFLVDVPMYWSRWLADEANGRLYMSITDGLLDVSQRLVVSRRWEDWQHEVAWMTLYFSVAVWFSIALIHVSVLRPLTVNADSKRSAAHFGSLTRRVAH